MLKRRHGHVIHSTPAALLLGAAWLLATPGMGQLTVETPATISFGTYPAWETRTAHYELKNTGNSDLQIKKVRSTCGCATTGLSSETLPPGKTADLRVSVLPNSIFGNFKKATYILTSDPTTPIVQVWVEGHATPLVDVSPTPFVPAGILELGTPHEWVFTLKPNRDPIAFSELQTTSSVPISVSFSAPSATNNPGRICIGIPAQGSASTLNISIATLATYGTNTAPLKLSITGLIGSHLVAVPARISIIPHATTHRARLRFRIVGPRQKRLQLTPDSLALPHIDGVFFSPPTRDHTGMGLLVDVTFDASFIKRVQSEREVSLAVSIPGAAPASIVCVPPDPK